jgi:3-hydroxy acid dehydrogenase/malonic semialdehyde reductase
MIAIVTGATAGFGKAITTRLIKDGARVVGVGRRKETLDALSKELGPSFLPLALDIQDQTAVAKAFANLPTEFKNVDVLVNNAGLALGLDFAQNAKLEDWNQMVQTNINGLLYCTHAILPGMVERKKGHIVNMGSVAGEFAYPGGNVYGATKAFVRHFSLNLRADLLGTPIRVTDVEPGLAGGTEFSGVRFKGQDDKAKKVYEGTDPLTAQDIAETVAWITALPAHMNVNTISLMPVCQAFAPLAIDRKKP